MTSQIILEIALPTPLRRSFDYLLPLDISSLSELKPGIRVLVSFGKQQIIGILLAVKTTTMINIDKLKTITLILDKQPIFNSTLMELMQWASEYYQHPIGESFATAMPNLLRKGNTLLDEKTLNKSVKTSTKPTIKHGNLHLNAEQKPLIEEFTHRHSNQLTRQNAGFERILLEGVTGSGKTEIYLQLIEQILNQGKQAIVLVPEIGLTPQTLNRFEQRFNCPMAIFHSNLSDKKRLTYWQLASSGEAKIIIGTRSAVFTATHNLGIIIIDEEHDLSYKQQDGLRYSARDLAIVRAKLENIPIVLGSATPTIETLYNAEKGIYRHWQLHERAGNAQKPDIQIIDIRQQKLVDGIAESVLPHISSCLERNEQALIFINRRGYAPSLICHDCGWVSQCKACDARLNIHLGAQHLRCHHCNATEPIPRTCPDCRSKELVFTGVGTERIEKGLQQAFPDTPIFRIDRDTTSGKKAMSSMLDNIQNTEAAILVGTQMLAKGHHFPNVTLVVVVDADAALMGTDYRALERFGQLLTQVTGRSGRAEKLGRALIQTHYPNHVHLRKLLFHGYHRFAMDILAERQQLKLPPFSFQALIRLEDKDAQTALNTLQMLKQAINPNICLTLGPFPASLQRRAHHYRYQLLLHAETRAQLKIGIAELIAAGDKIIKPHKQRWSIDVDPQDMS